MKNLPLSERQENDQKHNTIIQHGLFNKAHFENSNSKQKNPQQKTQGEKWYNKYLLQLIMIPLAIGILIALFEYNLNQNSTQVKGEKTVLIPTITPTIPPSPTPIENCKDDTFNEVLWDIDRYYKKDQDGYLIQKTPSGKYPYRPITYNKSLPSVFKKLDVVYEANYQNNSTASAMLRIALYYGPQEILRVDMPNATTGRQVIGIWLYDSLVSNSVKPNGLEVRPGIAYGKTHEIKISATEDYQGNIQYNFSGYYMDNDPINPKVPFETIRRTGYFTGTPNTKELTLKLATSGNGKLKIKHFSFCSED